MLRGASRGRLGFRMDRALVDNGIEGRSREAVDRILERFQPVRADDLLPLLQQVQDEYGYLPADVLQHVSERTGIPTSRMYGVITFYALFHLEKRGRHTIRACRGTACHVRGGKGVIQAAQKYLGLADGETGEDFMFSFETAACLGACALSPVVVADGVYSGKVTPERVEQMLRSIEAAESGG
jgi:NADH-quinone oxidoreductase subunit E